MEWWRGTWARARHGEALAGVGRDKGHVVAVCLHPRAPYDDALGSSAAHSGQYRSTGRELSFGVKPSRSEQLSPPALPVAQCQSRLLHPLVENFASGSPFPKLVCLRSSSLHNGDSPGSPEAFSATEAPHLHPEHGSRVRCEVQESAAKISVAHLLAPTVIAPRAAL